MTDQTVRNLQSKAIKLIKQSGCYDAISCNFKSF